MSKRMINYVSAVSVLALSWTWSGAVQASIGERPLVVGSDIADSEDALLSRLATDFLMSATLKGYDIFSAADLQVALQEAMVPLTAEQARQLPAMMASFRLLGLGADGQAAAIAVMAEAIEGAPAALVSQSERVQLVQSLKTAGIGDRNTQLAQLELQIDQEPGIDCGNGLYASSEFLCTILQKQEDDSGRRGIEGYGG